MRIDFRAIGAWLILIWILTLIFFFVTGCTKTVKSVTEVRDTIYVAQHSTDTLNVQHNTSDTIYQLKVDTIYKTIVNNILRRDSVYIKEKGDTTIIYKEHWNTSTHHDTIFRSKVDTLYKVRTDTLYIDRSSATSDSLNHNTESTKEVVKEKRTWMKWGMLTLIAGVFFGAAYLLTKKFKL